MQLFDCMNKLDLRVLAGGVMFKSLGREIFIIFAFLYQAARCTESWTRHTRMGWRLRVNVRSVCADD